MTLNCNGDEFQYNTNLSLYKKKSLVVETMGSSIDIILNSAIDNHIKKEAVEIIRLLQDYIFPMLRGEQGAFDSILFAKKRLCELPHSALSEEVKFASNEVAEKGNIDRGHAIGIVVLRKWLEIEKSVESREVDIEEITQMLNAAFYTLEDKRAVDQYEFILNFLDMEDVYSEEKKEIKRLDKEANSVGNNKQKLRKLQKYMLEILVEFDRVCNENDLQYYLSEGTLLGAIRHNGFIPWDDDVDVMMPREDYDKFIEIAEKELSDEYNLDSFETNPNHWVLGAKVQRKKETEFYQVRASKLAQFSGPYIDVFPIDYLPKEKSLAQTLNFKNLRRLRRLLWEKTKFSKKKLNPIKTFVLKILAKLLSKKQIDNMIDKTIRKFNNQEHRFCVNKCSYYPLEKQIFPIDYFGKGKRVNFEGHSFLVPDKADEMIKKTYSEKCMSIPVLLKVQRHDFMYHPGYDNDVDIFKIQETEKKVLIAFDKICRQNNLRYYLAEGSLLGAIRHKGFIPWDDDVDVSMPREDYEKLCKLMNGNEKEGCILLDENLYSKYHLPFAKLVYLEKCGVKNELNKFPEYLSGPNIDIFPLDNGVPKDTYKRRIQIRFFRDTLFYKEKYITTKDKNLLRKIPYYVQWVFSYKKAQSKMRGLLIYYNNIETGYKTNYGSAYSKKKETFPVGYFEPAREVDFENIKVFIPKETEKMLEIIYGDYMKLPPVFDQFPHHSLVLEQDFEPRKYMKEKNNEI